MGVRVTSWNGKSTREHPITRTDLVLLSLQLSSLLPREGWGWGPLPQPCCIFSVAPAPLPTEQPGSLSLGSHVGALPKPGRHQPPRPPPSCTSPQERACSPL